MTLKKAQYLSKSTYIKGLQCHKALWLTKFQPELRTPVSTAQQAIFDSGNEVGVLAQKLFPNGVLVPFDGLSFSEQINRTKKAIAEGETTIYEATFNFDKIFVKVDILQKNASGWSIYEVKSSTECKEVFLQDIAIQYYVVAGMGLDIDSAHLIHINKTYTRSGDIEVNKLFSIQDVTENIVNRQSTVVNNLIEMRAVLCQSIPQIDIGHHCDEPYSCDFKEYCWSHIPADSVFDLRDVGKPDPFVLYQKGIVRLSDVQTNSLGWRQKLQVESYKTKKNVINKKAIKTFLDNLWYPLCFLDFETTFMTPIPLFDGVRPFQQIPFQYSLHMLEAIDSELKHFEFLAPPTDNPFLLFIESLIKNLPENSCILVWNQSFEKTRLAELGLMLSDYREKIENISKRITDLMIPFRQKDIYYWQFAGSYSIKAVLPAMVPGLSYDNLPINNGELASSA